MPKVCYGIKSLKNIIKQQKPSAVCFVTTKFVFKKNKHVLKNVWDDKFKVCFIPDGEKAKDWSEIEKLLKKWKKFNLDRKSLIIALGGGTVGDSVGFTSSIYMRGVPYIQVPTTLLSQVDSAHGGKTGINFMNYKNLVGSVYPALVTIIESEFLQTLLSEQIIDGLGEIIKAGFINDSKIITLLKKENVFTILKSTKLQEIIRRTIDVKNLYVSKDLMDVGIRQMLNFGHTVGHAVELKYKISHGKAVIIGMLHELFIMEKLGLNSPDVRKELVSLLDSLRIKIDREYRPDWKSLLSDKKIQGEVIILPVIEKVGKSNLLNVNLDDLKKLV